MTFKVSARTVLQLGAELISSDAVAFYELIKNSFDAHSPSVEISLVSRMPFDIVVAQRVECLKSTAHSATRLASAIDALSTSIYADAPDGPDFAGRLRKADDFAKLAELLDQVNTITVADTGSGMDQETLEDVFLTIGTRSRLKERTGRRTNRPILGEKGIGRLSAMRLGERLRVNTTTKGEKYWNLLDVDWRRFSHDSDDLVSDVPLRVQRGELKPDASVHGTRIQISALTAAWTQEKAQRVASTEFNKITDPFESAAPYPVVLRFNGKPVPIPRLDQLLFDHAHATLRASYTVEPEPILRGHVEYIYRNRVNSFELTLPELVSVTGVRESVLASLGSFDVLVYWFNRKLLQETVDGDTDRTVVKELLRTWSGGLKLYRDGFRVAPYGDPEDDWLDLDRKALAAQGYKVNRAQLVGRVRITSRGNPALLDQTNREGLRESAEKEALTKILKSLLEVQFRRFLTDVDAEVQALDPVSFAELGERVLAEEKEIRQALTRLIQKYPQVRRDSNVVEVIQEAARKIRDLMDEAERLAESIDKGHSQLLHLAGLGLMVEILAHELNRTTHNTLTTVTNAAKKPNDAKLGAVLRTLESQLKTLEKRLRVLDPLSISGRQHKETFDLIAWVEDVMSSHSAQFDRHGIVVRLNVVPSRPSRGMPIKAVKGMIVQILENLISNSVYWLKVQKRLSQDFTPTISVEIDTRAREIRMSDNGPGVDAKRREEIFQPFVTSKPPGEGKGLGLYISREIAKYNGASLELSAAPSAQRQRLSTFVLRLGAETSD